MTTTVTGKNQITIPAKVATAHGIAPGTRLEWQSTEAPDTLIVKILPNRAALAKSLQGLALKYLKPGSNQIEDIAYEREREEAERAESL